MSDATYVTRAELDEALKAVEEAHRAIDKSKPRPYKWWYPLRGILFWLVPFAALWGLGLDPAWAARLATASYIVWLIGMVGILGLSVALLWAAAAVQRTTLNAGAKAAIERAPWMKDPTP